jgi:hypothetical protein
MKICLAGDLFLGGDLLNKDAQEIIQIDCFNNADVRIVNLEQPISDSKTVEDKCTLFTGSYAVNQLNEMRVNAVNLAHNHIQDKGIEGIHETIGHLKNGSIGTFGAGVCLNAAKNAFYLTDEVVLLGYCEFDKPYLREIVVAGENKAGVNPLRYENILEDLEKLPEGNKAILYFHWGREHVWLPPYNDLALAKKLLEHEKVLLIAGMHPHRIQGYIEHKGKRAYMSLGNFLFPNFYIKPPTQLFYPIKTPEKFHTTRQYHSVDEVTYKKWRGVNRVSLLLNINTANNEISHSLAIQDDDKPVVNNLVGVKLVCFSFWLQLLVLLYKLPKWCYVPLEEVVNNIQLKLWRAGIYYFKLKQLGLKSFMRKLVNKIVTRITRS